MDPGRVAAGLEIQRERKFELYDLATDPLQLHNLGRHPRRHPVYAALRAAWWRFKDCAGASCRALYG